ncbi:MAG TPA: FAD-dependent oxidoreductase [Terriglobales bacterium]|nr:FAD-dependent oxidoreductase [Terriglobales bacterium]
MRAVIVGSGLAGTMAAKTLRELDPDVEIEVFGEEGHPYYPRPNLVEFLAGRLPMERLFAFPPDWHVRQRIHVRTGERVVRLLPSERRLELASGGRLPYDVLLLAGGGRAVLPPVRGTDRKGVFVLRTLEDALAIQEHVKSHPRTAVVGGGLLGLEIARALKSAGAEVRVVEVLDRLLPRQLDAAGGAILKGEVEKMGIEVRLGTVTEEISGGAEARGLRFQGGDAWDAETVILAAGVRPETEEAREAGLAVNRGIVADDLLRTSAPAIFAAGDAAEHKGVTYGHVPAAFEQSRAAAYNMLGLEKPYAGTVPSATLKVAGLSVASFGLANPLEAGYEVLAKGIPEQGVYKKIVLKDGLLVGAIWMGTKKGLAEVGRLVGLNKNVAHRKGELLEDAFDWSGV